MFTYDAEKLIDELHVILRDNVPPEVWTWLREKGDQLHDGDIQQLNTAFAAAPRKTGRNSIILPENQKDMLTAIRNDFFIDNWTIDRVSRVWLLLNLNRTEKINYITSIEGLFRSAEMNELVALYSALPVLAYPHDWKHRCTEGIRNNISNVLEAIMIDNPYPAENLDEAAWNQLVLKAIFTEKPIHKIIGIDARANQRLADTLSDYAHERWAAHRSVHPQLWRCVGKFINESIMPDIERIAYAENSTDREAAMLACSQSQFMPARVMLEKNLQVKSAIKKGELTWNKLAERA